MRFIIRKISIWYLSSYRLIRTAWPISYIRVGRDTYASPQGFCNRLLFHYIVGQNFSRKFRLGVLGKILFCGLGSCKVSFSNTSIIHPKGRDSSEIGNLQVTLKNWGLTKFFECTIKVDAGNDLSALLKPKCLLHMSAFGVYTINLMEKQPVPTTLLKNLKIFIFCSSETHKRSAFGNQMKPLSLASLFTLTVIPFLIFIVGLEL